MQGIDLLVEMNKVLKENYVDLGKLKSTLGLLDFVLDKACNKIENGIFQKAPNGCEVRYLFNKIFDTKKRYLPTIP